MRNIWTLLLMLVAALGGLYLGWISGRNSKDKVSDSPDRGLYSIYGGKLDNVLNIIQSAYVDQVDKDSLEEIAIPHILHQLDPHSVYIPRSDVERVAGELKSDFGGIGVMFNIKDDTVMVISVIAGGPSSAVGVLPGDKIIAVDGKSFAGAGITNDKVLDTLRGEIGTQVKITVLRGSDTKLDFDIVRGEIPLYSVVSTYEIAPHVGYIKIDRFAEKTYNEMITSIGRLKADGCDKLIVDLRSNSGGFLNVVMAMCNEFLKADEMIVYTEGSHHVRQVSKANGTGTCQDMGIVVLIDEFSASASEIFAGAMQDNDRGTVVGRRSFGKGLVQSEFQLGDGSNLRLTVSRYHTPSGRCIQRPYDNGDYEYYNDINERLRDGELFDADRFQADTVNVFYTLKKHRKVYGGGGIIPDIFVPYDSAHASSYLYTLRSKRLIYDYALSYVDAHRNEFTGLSLRQLAGRLLATPFIEQIYAFAARRGVAKPASLDATEAKIIENEVRAYVARSFSDANDGLYLILNTMDPAIDEALKVFEAKPIYK
ncbi:MAG: S41 family peptidase [Bacteroidales bacterium]|nr:S41 family peptidase [Bacteroidales bacterium]